MIALRRRITTCLVLVALVGIYAMPLAAAFSPNAIDCCAAGMCPIPGRSMSHHHSVAHQSAHQEMPDCDMGKLSGSMRKCEMSACETQKDNVVNVGLFVLFAPIGIVQSKLQVPVLAKAVQSEHTVSQIPATPPPRTSLS